VGCWCRVGGHGWLDRNAAPQDMDVLLDGPPDGSSRFCAVIPLGRPHPGSIGASIRVDSLWILPFLRAESDPETPPPSPLPLAGEGEPETEVRRNCTGCMCEEHCDLADVHF